MSVSKVKQCHFWCELLPVGISRYYSILLWFLPWFVCFTIGDNVSRFSYSCVFFHFSTNSQYNYSQLSQRKQAISYDFGGSRHTLTLDGWRWCLLLSGEFWVWTRETKSAFPVLCTDQIKPFAGVNASSKSDPSLRPSSHGSSAFKRFVYFPTGSVFFRFIFSAVAGFLFVRAALAFALRRSRVARCGALPIKQNKTKKKNTGDAADACRSELMRCPAGPKSGSSSGLCSRRAAGTEADLSTDAWTCHSGPVMRRPAAKSRFMRIVSL